ncbi:uncharacterized protein LTHEOB_2120 [Lasiodiplodia theobromae]|uniref:uncharacterized protein n=1 Tax=Lasiodiplodia theobromae TaxID=45133 RepID=UPI0015C3C4D1|nr:uncharacterized protein LTHEOB_2120 [Lasiodiplodia theobromae]KAF4536359.1 hypothetical protein LTHEOB_2120 [Lasiodiplodia theobromae]
MFFFHALPPQRFFQTLFEDPPAPQPHPLPCATRRTTTITTTTTTTMPPRRAIGTSGFDIVAQGQEGAMQLWQMVHQEPAKFQAARSLYMQISTNNFDDADDDMWAVALEAFRPGNVKHNLQVIKIVVVSDRLLEPYSKTILSSAKVQNSFVQQQNGLNNGRGSASRIPLVSRCFFAERAFFKALSNIRGVERVEIAGPMEASLKKMLAVAMTTRPGHKVRDWRYGGGLRSAEDISWGSWSATMQPAAAEGLPAEQQPEVTAHHELERFDLQTFLPKQPMQIVDDATVEADGTISANKLGTVEEMARPKLALDGSFSPSRPDGGFATSNCRAKRADSHLSDGGSESAKRGAKRAKRSAKIHKANGGGSEGPEVEFTGMSPQPTRSQGEGYEYTEAIDTQDEDGRVDEGGAVGDEDVEMDEDGLVPSDDPNDEDYRD